MNAGNKNASAAIHAIGEARHAPMNPILGMSMKDNILYISLASKGITSYKIGSNFEFTKVEDVLFLFNPKKFII